MFLAFSFLIFYWAHSGYLAKDEFFYTRSADMFFHINDTGTGQGMVGMWCGLASTLGTAIRATCQNEEDARVIRMGLNEEQYHSMKFEPDLYAEYDLNTAYEEKTGEDGKPVYVFVCDSSSTLKTALMGQIIIILICSLRKKRRNITVYIPA